MNRSYLIKKGKVFERFVAKELSRKLQNTFRRTPCSGAFHHSFESDIMKIGNKPSIVDGWVIETKNQKNLALPQWIKQCEEEAKRANTRKWLLIFKNNGKGVATLSLDELLNLLKKAQNKVTQNGEKYI